MAVVNCAANPGNSRESQSRGAQSLFSKGRQETFLLLSFRQETKMLKRWIVFFVSVNVFQKEGRSDPKAVVFDMGHQTEKTM